MNQLDSAYAASYLNGIIASSYANPLSAQSALNLNSSRVAESALNATSRTRPEPLELPPQSRVEQAPNFDQLQDARPRRFGDILPAKPLLSPADEAAIFGSADFLALRESDNYGQQRAAQLPSPPSTDHTSSLFPYDFDLSVNGDVHSPLGASNNGLFGKVAALYARNEALLEENFFSGVGLN